MSDFNLKLSDDPEDMKTVSAWLDSELSKKEKEKIATSIISEKIKPYLEEAFNKLNEKILSTNSK